MAAVNPSTVVLEGYALCSSCWELESIQAEQFASGISKNKMNTDCILNWARPAKTSILTGYKSNRRATFTVNHFVHQVVVQV